MQSLSTVVSDHVVRLRDLRRLDGKQWRRIRLEDQAIIEPVEPTLTPDWDSAHSKAQWRAIRRNFLRAQNNRAAFAFVIEIDGEFAGQISLINIQWGISCSGFVGYWLDSTYTGQGIGTAALGLMCDYAFSHGIHRIEATVLPDNASSIRVLEKNNFTRVGLLEKNLHINGQWRDHFLYGLLKDDFLA